MKVNQVLKVLILALWIGPFTPAAAQSISKSVIGSSGTMLSADNHRLSFTVGEPVVGTMTGTGNQLGNGFLTSLDLSVLSIPEKEVESLMEVYPNPATNYFICRQKDSHPLLVRARNTDGKLVMDARIESGDKTDVKQWKQGLYILDITDLTTHRQSTSKMLIYR